MRSSKAIEEGAILMPLPNMYWILSTPTPTRLMAIRSSFWSNTAKKPFARVLRQVFDYIPVRTLITRLKDKAMAPISVMPCWAYLQRLPQPPLSQEIFKTLTQYYNAGIAFLACLNGIQNRFIMAGDCIHSTKLRTTQRYCVWRIKRSCLLSQTWQHIEWHNFCHYTASKKGATCPKSS